MNYLTNYYKNLSEQLQEQVNYLEKLLEAYPGGMTPGREEVLNRAARGRYSRNATPADMQKSHRAEALLRRGRQTDMKKANQEREAMEATVSSMPDFHNKIVTHLSTTFGGQFPHINGDRQKSIQDIAAKLHKAGGEGGFKTFDNVMAAMGNIVHDSDSFRDHLETQAMEDPTKYGVHYDDIMDVDMSDEVEDFIGDLAHTTLHTLHGKK
jgi:hypothetical protein